MNKPISLIEAALPLFTLLALLVFGGIVSQITTELLVFILFIAASVAGITAMRHGHAWEAIQRSTGDRFASVLPVILILLSIGMLIGTWMFSGTIPALVYYGVQKVNPQFMIATAFLTTAVMSMTGSSWAAAGTIGVALMGVATTINAPLASTAGAVVSGAYFGDKLSPLSDQTNICAIASNADLYDHIRNMAYTAGPSFVIALLVYFVAGLVADEGYNVNTTHPILAEIKNAYRINPVVFVPALILILGTFSRKPAALVMAFSSTVAMIIGMAVHGFSAQNAVISAINGFDVSMTGMTQIPSEVLTSLLNRGGINSMSTTLILIIAAFLLAAGMDVSGGLNKLLNAILSKANSVLSLIAATLASGATMIALSSHGGVTALIVGGLFQSAYKDQGLAPENLARSLEDSATITEPLMPWTVSALFMATTLGVPTLEYLPWAIFCMTGWMFSLLLAASYPRTGFGLKPLH